MMAMVGCVIIDCVLISNRNSFSRKECCRARPYTAQGYIYSLDHSCMHLWITFCNDKGFGLNYAIILYVFKSKYPLGILHLYF